MSAAADAPARAGLPLTLLLAGLAAVGTLSTTIILPAFGSMASDLGVAPGRMGLVLSSFLVAFAVAQLAVGPLSDHVGRRTPILWGLGLFAAGSFVCAVAPSFGALLVGRVLQAVGVAGASVLARAIARDLFEGEALARTLALVMIAMAAAPGFSPLLGSGLDAAVGWRAVFAIVGALGLGLAAVYAARLGETHPCERRRRQRIGDVAAGYRALLRDPAFARPAVAVALVMGGLFGFFGTTPAILMQDHGLAPAALGLFFAATVFVVFAAGFAAPRIAHRLGLRRAATLGALVAAAGGAVLLAMPSGLAGFSLGVVVFLAGMGVLNPLGTSLALGPFGAKAGAASALLGFLQMAVAAAATAAPSLLPFAVDRVLALELTLLGLTAFLLLLGGPVRRS